VGFYPLQESQDGSWHDLKVGVAKGGVSVRYRRNYFASKTAAPANERPTLDMLLKDPLDATLLELVAEPMPDPARPGSWLVYMSVDLHGVQLERQNDIWVGAVDVTFLKEGSRAGRTITATMRIPDKLLAASLEKGIAVNDSVALDDRTGVLRIVAQDRATVAAGSVRVPLSKR
jgi:hypothetical protein